MALAFPGTEENPHFERAAFKVVKKRIFATLLESKQSANIVLSPAEQSEFCALGEQGIYPVPNKWGEKGWTTFELSHLPDELVVAALELAYNAVINK